MELELCTGDSRLDLCSRAGQVQKSMWAGAWMGPLLQPTLSGAAPNPQPCATALVRGTCHPRLWRVCHGPESLCPNLALLSQPGPPSEVLLDDVRDKGQAWDWKPDKGEMLSLAIPNLGKQVEF